MIDSGKVFMVRDRGVSEVLVMGIGCELGEFLFEHLGHGVKDL